ncbi:hypothetical protein A2U01_0047539, partial [Trifolium medium]|nr:hypothetical protein [Trifolium medium]
SAQNPLKQTPQIAYPRLLSEILYQCALTDRIERAQVWDLLEEQLASFINGNTLVNIRLVNSKSLKYPTQPLLERRTKEPIPENPTVLFSNEPPDVILENMRLMKAEGIIITGADIAKVSPDDKQKKRKRIVKVKQEKVIEVKTSGNTSASGAEAFKAKFTEDKKATETAATEDIGASET